ncbi:OmpA family protein [Pseudomonas nitroreducens]|uniref:OmpA family protein n=1 Tax=Pseudomonas nitroreducens TaxID=46680 RepID=UPI00265A0C33|nr:OmpA family protein [Pseudomonas nitroreducens]MCP1649828.1 outer membrane protein OmpA-like peptidoglycan-associated protein [Pseudomonas nitroreducens]MCP1687443.1 outer membrane protein OmpA-like peptidoglycan-associated protein [Pseudomonas nitroreducens]
MSMKFHVPALSLLLLALAGCSTTPENVGLVSARSQFEALQSKPDASRLAALETREAFSALAKAETLSNQDRKDPAIDQAAYLASSKIAVAEQTILLRQAESAIQGLDAERTRVRLDVRTAQLKALQAMNAKPSDRGTVVTFGDVLFDTGKADLRSGSLRNLQQLADFLRDNPERQVRVEGFTDSVGGDDYNQQLSERRAQSVAFALQRLGVSPDRTVSAGYGKQYPVANNASAQSRQMNRRVEVIISAGRDAVPTRR